MYQYIINLENSARIEIDGLHRKIERMQEYNVDTVF